MIIQTLDLHNFCQHRNRSFEFSPRLNLIVGPNGSGKTNMLRGMQLGLTGAAGGAGQKVEDITQHSEDASNVRLSLTHDDSTFVIHRGLRPTSNTLHVNGELTGRTVAEINEELYRRLGTTKQQISDYIFVKQRGIDAWLDKRDADRAKELGELFHLQDAEQIWNALGQYVSTVEIPLVEHISELTRELATAQQQVTTLEADLAQYSDVPADLADYVKDKLQIVSEFEQLVQLEQEITNCEAELQQCEETCSRCEVTIGSLTDTLSMLGVAKEGLLSRDEIHRYNAEWATYNANANMRELLASREQALLKATEALPPLPTGVALAESELQAVKSLNAKQQRRKDLLQSKLAELLKTQVGTPCPTCGKPIDDPAPTIAKLQRELEELSPLLRDSATVLKAQYEIQAAASKRATADKRITQLNTDITAIKAKIADVAKPNKPMAYIDEQKGQLDEIETGEQLYNTDLAGYKASLAANKENSRKLVAKRDELIAAKAVAPERDEADAQQARLEISAMQARVYKQQAASRNLAAATVAAQQAATLLRAGQANNVIREQRIAARAHLESLRDIFHRNELPRMVAYTYLERMQVSINDTLELFDAPFRVTASEDLGFDARFDDGRTVMDRRLSVGERIVLAMAFRITINSTFASSLGVLIMDEPTAGLDEHNLGCLPQALERLRALSDSCGLQILFVTHEPRISHLFDKVIDLSNAS